MPYVPINASAYTAAYAGAISGMAVTGWITSPDKTNYVNETIIAGTFAQAFDIAWNNATALNYLELAAITTVIESDFRDRGPAPFSNTAFQDPNNWMVAARACVALILECDDYFAGQGINSALPNGALSVANLAQLTNLPLNDITGKWKDGTEVWVATLRCPAELDTTSESAVSGEVFNSSEPGRKWRRKAYPPRTANPWEKQTNWWVDTINGNDEATGATLTQALASFSEWRRRLDKTRLTRAYFVNFASSIDTLNVELDLGPTAYVVFDFQPAAIPLASAHVAAYVPPNGTNQWAILSLVEALDLTPYLNKRIRFASGAICFIALVNPAGGGTNTARVQIPYLLDPTLPGYPFGGPLAPVGGESLVIEQLATIGSASLTYAKDADATNPLNQNTLVVANAQIGDATGLGSLMQAPSPDFWQTTFWACDMQVSLATGSVACWACRFDAGGIGVWIAGLNDSVLFNLWGCLVSDPAGMLVVFTFFADTLFQGAQCYAEGNRCAFVYDVGFFNTPDDPLVAYGAGIRLEFQGRLYGANNAGYGINFISGGTVAVYGVKPTITGAAGALRMHGINYAWAAVPVFDPLSGCGFIANVP